MVDSWKYQSTSVSTNASYTSQTLRFADRDKMGFLIACLLETGRKKCIRCKSEFQTEEEHKICTHCYIFLHVYSRFAKHWRLECQSLIIKETRICF